MKSPQQMFVDTYLASTEFSVKLLQELLDKKMTCSHCKTTDISAYIEHEGENYCLVCHARYKTVSIVELERARLLRDLGDNWPEKLEVKINDKTYEINHVLDMLWDEVINKVFWKEII